MLDFAGADAEGQCAERAVRGRVAVAADDGHARLRVAQFGADHVDDALVGVVDVVEADAELAAIARAACRSAASRSDRQSAGCDRWWARCGRRWPRSARAAAPAGPPAAAPRTPGHWSPHGPVGDRCRGSVCFPGSAWTTWSSQIFSNIVRGERDAVMAVAPDQVRKGGPGKTLHYIGFWRCRQRTSNCAPDPRSHALRLSYPRSHAEHGNENTVPTCPSGVELTFPQGLVFGINPPDCTAIRRLFIGKCPSG